MKWCEVHIIVAAEAHEAVAELCRQVGAQGVQLEADRVITAFPVTEWLQKHLQRLRGELSRLPEWGLPPVQRIEQRERDESEWAESWKRFFHVLHLGKRIVVQPSWEEYEAQEGEVVIALDPGMAFGTGQHATTQLCLEFLEELILPGMQVVDVGTGSGILAIAAAKLGASSVWAADSDPVAVLTAERNVIRNGVQRVVSVQRAEGCEGAPPCDLLVANISTEVILQLLPDFSRCLRRGGWLVVSGILTERREGVRVALSRTPWYQAQVRERGEWCAFAARRG
ncbi:MAG: 50S ribosomal protein L11 methyltransferase [Armatimonadota bacterium]|nr:50S ribosomal protein L11 methyltransferase [Armatimonadota bacterium]